MTRALDIYFIANPKAGVVKIGRAFNARERLASIQTGNHADLYLVYNFRSHHEGEKILHQFLAKERIRGEWFRYTGAVDELIEDIEEYRSIWAGADMWPDEYVMQPDEVQFVVDTHGKPWGMAIPE